MIWIAIALLIIGIMIKNIVLTVIGAVLSILCVLILAGIIGYYIKEYL